MTGVVQRVVFYGLLVVGGFMVCDGMWLKAKAVLAQHLLRHAWEETQRTGVAIKPWPWADSWPVARLKVSHLGVEHIVLEGDSGEVLAFGPGHLSSSAFPGKAGNCVLAGHRDTSFTFLERLLPGDRVELETIDGNLYTFQVTATTVTDKKNLYLEDTETHWLTMITCYPFNSLDNGTDQRYVVFARLKEGVTI